MAEASCASASGDRKKGMSPGAPPASADVLLHTKCGVRCIWRHNLPTIVTFESRETKKTESHVWSRKYVCHETEATLRKQYKRNHDGTREAPPERCTLLLTIEHGGRWWIARSSPRTDRIA